MTEQQVFILADQALNDVVQHIKDDQWAMRLPDDFSRADPSKPVTLREIIAYHAYDDAWVPAMLAGRTMDEVGRDTFDGDLLGENPKAAFAAIVAKAVAAADQLTDSNAIVHFSYGDFPASEALKHITSFRGLRVYDLSKVIGIDTTMPAELVQGLWDELRPNIEDWRAMGVFPAAVPVPADAPLQDRLLGMTGRQPS